MFTFNLKRYTSNLFQVSVRNYAARKGTRERKKKGKVKVEEVKEDFMTRKLREKEKLLSQRASKKFDDSWKTDPVDNVYVMKYFKRKRYPFLEAIQCHKETHHPEVYNQPNAQVNLTIELNMQGEKKTRFVDNFSRLVAVPHPFEHGEERSVIAFSKSPEAQQEAIDAGAQLAGGIEIIKKFQNGEISLADFKYIIAHPDILPELVVLRGLMKRRFPNPKGGTLGIDIKEMVDRFLHGVSYSAAKDDYEKDFGVIKTVIGTLNMDDKQLEENFIALLTDVNSVRPKRDGDFIVRCLLFSPPSSEEFMVDYGKYLVSEQPNEEEDEESVKAVVL